MSDTFQRARTADQRAERVGAILAAARSMLEEMPVHEITLNGIARRSGFAPSNVLRYFDSREAVLLALVSSETEAWLDDLTTLQIPETGSLVDRCRSVAGDMARTMESHPRFCDLVSVQAAVLERNVSSETVLAFKSESVEQLQRLADWQETALPELAGEPLQVSLRLATRAVLIAGALWAQSRPAPAVAAKLADHPELLQMQAPFVRGTEETVSLLLFGAASIATGNS